jgi:c(7)-type cytochrome triheme protein
MKAMKLTVLFVSVMFAANAFCVAPGNKVDYAGGPLGNVVFYGTTHEAAGLRCTNCHTKIFSIRPSDKIRITEQDHVPDKFCGVCHNGEGTFSVEDKNSCGKCHRKDR